MLVNRHAPLPDYRLILSWTAAIGVLWLLLLWKSVGLSAHDFSAHAQSQPVNSSDARAQLYAAGEHQFSPRRSSGVASPLPLFDPLTPIVSTLFFTVLAIFSLPKVRVAFCALLSPIAHQLQLATLNISRAPPSLR